MLLWISIGRAASIPGEIPPIVTLPSWEAIVGNSPVIIVLALVIRWFMAHVENKDKALFEIIGRKDQEFTQLAKDCHAELQNYGVQVLATQRELVTVIRNLTDKK